MRDWLTYRLSDFLLFTQRTYYRMFELYHDAVWPLQLAVLAIVIGIAVSLRRSDASRGVVISALLAMGWLWVGIAFHLQRYATINWAAKYFGAAFIVESALLVWYGVIRRLPFRDPNDAMRRFAPVVFVASVVIPPLAVLAQDRGWSQVDLAWLTPDATAMMTLALLLGATPRAPRLLLVVPIAWCLIAALTLYALESPEAWVTVVAVIASCLALRGQRRSGLSQPDDAALAAEMRRL